VILWIRIVTSGIAMRNIQVTFAILEPRQLPSPVSSVTSGNHSLDISRHQSIDDKILA
jgi:hypothetical protein